MPALLTAKTAVVESIEIVVTDINNIREGVDNTTHAVATLPDGSKENLYVWVYTESKYQDERKDVEWLAQMKNKTVSLPESLNGKKAVGLIYCKERYLAVVEMTKKPELSVTVRGDKIVEVNGGPVVETYLYRWLVQYTDRSWTKKVLTLVAYLHSNGVISEVPHITLDTEDLHADNWLICGPLMSLTDNVKLYQTDGSLAASHWQQLAEQVDGRNASLDLTGGQVDAAAGPFVAQFCTILATRIGMFCTRFKNVTLAWGFGGIKFEDFSDFVRMLEGSLTMDPEGTNLERLDVNKVTKDEREEIQAMGKRMAYNDWKLEHIGEPLSEDESDGWQIILKKE